MTRRREERHQALLEAVKAGRRVQRALVDTATGAQGIDERYTLEHAVNSLTEVVAALRVVVDSEEVVDAFREFEEKAKELQRNPPTQIPPPDSDENLRLSPLISAIQKYESRV